MTPTFFDRWPEDVLRGTHVWDLDRFKAVLLNAAPATTARDKADLTQIAEGGGYTHDGVDLGELYVVDGVVKGSAVVLTATAAWRYIVIYNDSKPGRPLIMAYDRGLSATGAATLPLTDGLFTLS